MTDTVNSTPPESTGADTQDAANGREPDFIPAQAMEGNRRSLDPRHLKMLFEDRDISLAVIEERGYFSVHEPWQLQMMGLAGAPAPGIVIPTFPPAMKPGGEPPLVYRSDHPADPKRKYLWPAGVRARLDSPPRCHADLRNPDVTLYVTEGVPKGDALASHGACAVALGGVDSFGGKPEPGLPILADWEGIPLNNRRVRSIYDSDARRNANVMRAELRLTQFLRERGAMVEWVRLPDAADGSKQGIDDWFAAGHEMEELEALVVAPEPDPLVSLPRTDIGNAERFAHLNQGRAMWVDGNGWLAWDGRRWKAGAERLVDRLAIAAIRATHHAAVDLPAANQDREALVKHAQRSEHGQRIEAMIKWSRAYLMADADDLDTDPLLVNCPNGTLDLRTGGLRSHDPADHITKLCPVPYDPDAGCPTWEAFLRQAMAGNQEMTAYLQKLIGICLTGDVSEKFLPIIWGPSDAGKTTFTEVLLAMLGKEYAQEMGEATIAAASRKAGGSEAKPDLVRLQGVRLAVVSETGRDMQLNAARVKALTGRNRITARDLFKSQVDFDPTHKILIETNHKPGMREGDEATFNRVHLIPFEVVIPKAEQDKELPARLRAELPGILAWAARGCRAWREAGRLAPPPQIVQATDAYRKEADPINEFIEDWCVEGPNRFAQVADLYRAYRAWASASDENYPLGKQRFNATVASRPGITREPRQWVGIGLAGVVSGQSEFERRNQETQEEDEGE